MNKSVISAILSSAFILPALSWAQPATPNAQLLVFSGQTTQIIAQRLPDPKSRQNVSAQVLKPEDSSSVTQLLSSTPLLYTQSYGNGHAWNVNYRGFADKTNTLVLLDGVKLNDPQNSSVLWSAVPLDNVERIELLEGGNSFIYGEGALAGAINIVTRRTPDPGRLLPVALNVDYMSGRYGKAKQTYQLGQHTTLLDWSLLTSHDQGNTFRNNSFFKDDNFSFKSTVNLNPLTVGIHRQYVNTFSNLPGPLSTTQNESDQAYSPYTTDAQYREKLWANTGWLQVALDKDQTFKLQYNDRTRTQYSYIFMPVPYDMGARTWVAEYAGRAYGLSWVAGGEYTSEQVFVSNGSANSRRKLAGAYASAVVPLVERISLNLAGRYDRASIAYNDLIMGYDLSWNPILRTGSMVMSGFSPQAGLTWQADEANKLRLSFSRTFKVTPFEDFAVMVDAADKHYKSNVDVEPQIAHNTEFSYTHEGQGQTFSINYYYMYLPNEILYNPATWANENFETAHTGESIAGELFFSQDLSIRSSLMFDQATYLAGANKGKALPAVNSSRFFAGIQTQPLPSLHLNVGYHAFGPYYPINDVANQLQQAGYSYVDINGDYALGEMTIYGGINNLFNTYYQASVVDWTVLNYYPANRRDLYAGVKFKL